MLHLTLCLNTVNQALLNSFVNLNTEQENETEVVSLKDKRLTTRKTPSLIYFLKVFKHSFYS